MACIVHQGIVRNIQPLLIAGLQENFNPLSLSGTYERMRVRFSLEHLAVSLTTRIVNHQAIPLPESIHPPARNIPGVDGVLADVRLPGDS